MIYFFDRRGRITRRLSAPTSEAVYAAQTDERWISSEKVFSDETHFISNGLFCPFPQRPSLHHEWDWTSLEWKQSPTAVVQARVRGAELIDTAAGLARSRHITTVPGQSETYTAKYQEALAFIAAGYPVELSSYPFIAGESQPHTWMTPMQAATRIATLGSYWRDVLGPAIEAIRVNGKDALDFMSDPVAIDAHTAAVVADLNSI